jgi:hypothetical protein
MGGKSKAPKAPDYASLAKQDAAAQLDAANQITGWNRPNQTDIYGNTVNWTRTPDGGWNQDVSLGGNQQKIQDMSDALKLQGMGGIGGMPEFQYEALNGGFGYGSGTGYSAGNSGGSGPLNYSGSSGGYSGGGGGGSFNPPSGNPAAKTADPGEFTNTIADLVAAGGDPGKFKGIQQKIGKFDSTQGDRVAADMYESAMSRFRPENAQQQEALDVKLRLQGLQPGTEAYNRAMQNHMTTTGDIEAKLALDATGAGYGAARDIYNTNLAGQNQKFGQKLGGWQANLGRNDQLERNNLARTESNFGRLSDSWSNNLARQGQLEGQNIDREGIAAPLAAAHSASSAASANARMQYDLGKMQEGRLSQGQMFDQALTAYQLPYQRYAAMTGMPGAQTGFEGFGGATGYNPASMSNAAQNTYNANMAGYNAQQGKGGSILGAGAQLGSAYLGRPQYA